MKEINVTAKNKILINAEKTLTRKILRDDVSKEHYERNMLMLEREVNVLKLLGGISTPKITKYDKNFIEYEYIGDYDLKRYIQNNNLPLDKKLKIIKNIIYIYQFIQDKGILHCDIKEENIMIDKNMNIKVIDFGNAIKIGGDLIDKSHLTVSITHISVIDKKDKPTIQSELFSLALLFYYILSENDMNESNIDIISNIHNGYKNKHNIPKKYWKYISKILNKNKYIPFSKLLKVF